MAAKRFKYLLVLGLLASLEAPAQHAPELEFVCELRVKLKEPLVVGKTPRGLRRIIPITGGTVEGPAIKGEILDGGADWQFIREDGVAELEAHYQFRIHDGVLIYITNNGMRVATPEVAGRIARGEPVQDSEYYFAAVPRFEAPEGPYHWMNNAIFICKGKKYPDSVAIQVWKVL